MKYSLYKIKAGKRQKWLDWCAEIMDKHIEEGRITLAEEDLARETCLVFGEGDDTFVVYMHQPIEGKTKKPANMDREINRKHFEIFNECLEPMKPRILGYDIESKG